MASLQIHLDMDGVLSDFVTAALELHQSPDAIHDWPPGEFNMARVLGISSSEFWGGIDRQGADYWARLKPYPWFAELTALAREFGEVSILTSPSQHPDCPAGKVRWIHEHLGKGFRDFLIGPPKYLCARPGAVLIDDSDRNVDRFRLHGGQAILFPQPWNSNHAITDRLAFVRRELEAARKK